MSEINLVQEEGELMPNPNNPPPEEGSPLSQPPCVPVIDDALFLRSPFPFQFSVDRDLANGWTAVDNYLSNRYGLRELSGQVEDGLSENFPIRLGLCKGSVLDLSASRLFSSAVESTALPRECDLSRDYESVDGGFPHRSPSNVLKVDLHETGYLVTISDNPTRPWKLLIEDPLTLIQIEREEWDLQADTLVLNLVLNGLPFNVLYPSCQRSGIFHKTRGPIVHPEGKCPTRVDYMTYLLDVADFFNSHPHAYVAALCAGGIFWRIAVDVLPLPTEREIVRPFNPRACTERTVNGKRYWSPKLTLEEEEVIAGVYKWAGKPSEGECKVWRASILNGL